MKCKKCHKKNRKIANYCRYCGNPFTKKEQEEANKKGIVAKIRKIEKWYEVCTLKVITENIFVRILILILILLPGILSLLKNGSHLKIMDTKDYEITYNEKKEEYYIYLEEKEKVSLKLYVPNKIKKLELDYYGEDNKRIDKQSLTTKDEIMIEANKTKDNYYVIYSLDNKKEKLKIYAYVGGE